MKAAMKAWVVCAMAGVLLAAGPLHAQTAQPKPAAPAAKPAAPAAKPGTPQSIAPQAFTEADAGVFQVLDSKGQPVDIAYRFYAVAGKWNAEERAPDGGWNAFKCEKDCEILPMPQDEMAALLGKYLDGMVAGCIGNANFAVCRYVLKSNPVSARYMMMVRTDKGISLVHLVRIAQI